METVTFDKKIIFELLKMFEEMNERLESLELASDPELMESLRKSKEEIARGDVVEFNDL